MNTGTESATIDKAIESLWQKNILNHNGRRIQVVCLLRTADYRPLKAYWWKGKEVYLMGADVDGNFLLRHCDGSVRLWDHLEQTDVVLSASVREFSAMLKASDELR